MALTTAPSRPAQHTFSLMDDQVLDALAALLREFGRWSFDLERQDARKTQAQFDQWAQHALTGVAAPGVKVVGSARAWNELQQQFSVHRKAERTEFTQAQDALRDVVWTFISSLNREVAADRADDAKLGQTLATVASSLPTAPPADLRKLAMETVKQVQQALSARRERQDSTVRELSGKLESLGTQLEVARRESTLDGLTGLFNRKAFDEQLGRTAEWAQLNKSQAALVLFDIDHFKQVNDQHGHPKGDAVLKAVAQCCSRVFKRKADFVARYGGEELVALLRDVSESEAHLLANRVREAVAALEVEGLKVTISAGAALVGEGEPVASWLSRADQALYRAKHTGRNRVCVAVEFGTASAA
ncbi:MAG: GGDEF domain-containing protein [Myxococcaceae bacterium]